MAITHNLTRTISTSGQIVWAPSGATGTTHNMDLNGLIAGSFCQGNYADLGATWEGEYAIQLTVETGTAPAVGGCYPLWLFCSQDTAVWPRSVTGSDAQYVGTKFLMRNYGYFDHLVVVTNDANQANRQNPKRWKPSGRYVTPVICNWTTQPARSNGTSVLSRIVLTKLRGVVST